MQIPLIRYVVDGLLITHHPIQIHMMNVAQFVLQVCQVIHYTAIIAHWFLLLPSTTYYAVALQIEDYYDSTSTTPMSSVPIQFLFFGRSAPSGCSTATIDYWCETKLR